MPGRRSFFALEGDPGILQTTPLHKIVDIFEMILKSHAADPAVCSQVVDGDLI